MLRGLVTLAVAFTLGSTPALAAAPRDLASTHEYLVASYAVLHTAVTTWSSVDTSVNKLNARLRAECPAAGAGSPQNEEGQSLSTEVAGALWATGYHTDAKIVRNYIKALGRLTWSNPAITRSARRLENGLREMLALKVPNLCGDIQAWRASGFTSVPADAVSYARHAEAIQIKEIPRALLIPFVQPSDKQLRARDERLAREFEELEISRGQAYWNRLLDTLALNQ